ncbi:enoyl-CoA hydratase [bacterium]|nr:enoyl-CoA hydratase [bacterium]
MEPTVLFSVEDGIALITLNRPQRHNAINQSLLVELYNCIDEITANKNIRVAILTGQGKSFCSGLDLDVIKTENLFNPRGDNRDLPDVMGACHKPFIGAINGNAITGGFELALNCDFLIASERAAFADTHARVGIHPGWGMTQLLQECVGQKRAKQISHTGQFFGAERAHQWGLVNEVVPHEMLIPRAKQIAGDICSTNPDMSATIKDLIEYRNQGTLSQAIKKERDGFFNFLKENKFIDNM